MNEELPPLPEPANEAATDDCTYACPEGYTAEQMREYARTAVLAERERCAKLCEMSPSAVRLSAGEMTAQEMRSVRAILTNRAAAIRGNG